MPKPARIGLSLLALSLMAVGCQPAMTPVEPVEPEPAAHKPVYKVLAAGDVIGNVFQIGNSTSKNEIEVAYNATADRYMVTWEEDDEFQGNPDELLAQLVAPDGTNIGAEISVASSANPDLESPTIAANTDDNEFLVDWATTLGLTNTVSNKRFSAATGAELGTTTFTSTATIQAQQHVAYNPNANQYLAVWQDNRFDSTTGRVHIFAQLLNADGTPVVGTSNQQLSDADIPLDDDHLSPRVVFNSLTNQYLVVWYEDDVHNIEARLVNGDGTVTQPIVAIPDSGLNTVQNDPDVAFDATNNQYLIAWQEQTQNVFARLVSGVGGALGTPGPVIAISDQPSGQFTPSVAYNASSNQFLATWSDSRVGGGVFGQRVGATGTLLGTEFPISPAGGLAGGHHVVNNSTAGEFLVVWNDGNVKGVRVAGATPDAVLPTWPKGSRVRATNVTPTSMTLIWTAATDDQGVANYLIFRNNVQIDTVPGNTLTYNATGLTLNTTYTFKIEAEDAAGNTTTDGPSIRKKTPRR